MHIDDLVTVVGEHVLAPQRLPAELHHLTRHVRTSHRNHFDRQRKAAEHIDHLALIDDTDEATRCRRDDLLAGQCATAALDESTVPIGLVCAINVEFKIARPVEVDHLDTDRTQTGG